MRTHIPWNRRQDAIKVRCDLWGEWLDMRLPGLSEPQKTPTGRLISDGWGENRKAVSSVAPEYKCSPGASQLHREVYLQLPNELKRVLYVRHVLKLQKNDLTHLEWISKSKYYTLLAEIYAYAMGKLDY